MCGAEELTFSQRRKTELSALRIKAQPPRPWPVGRSVGRGRCSFGQVEIMS